MQFGCFYSVLVPRRHFSTLLRTHGKHFNANPLRIVQTHGQLYGKAGSSNIFRAAVCRDSEPRKPISSYMSALLPKADISRQIAGVRQGPIADMTRIL